MQLGVKQVRFVEPAPRRVSIYALQRQPTVLHEADTLDGGDLLPGFQYPLSRLFDFDF